MRKWKMLSIRCLSASGSECVHQLWVVSSRYPLLSLDIYDKQISLRCAKSSSVAFLSRQWSRWEHINPLFLTFRQWSWEIPFLREPDPLFKFYIGCATFVLLFMWLIYLVPAFISSEYVHQRYVDLSDNYQIYLSMRLDIGTGY